MSARRHRRPYVVAVADQEGPLRTRVLPAAEAGRYVARVRAANPTALVTCEPRAGRRSRRSDTVAHTVSRTQHVLDVLGLKLPRARCGERVAPHPRVDLALIGVRRCPDCDPRATRPAPGGDHLVHVVGGLQHFLDAVGVKVPRALCGVRLVGNPSDPDPVATGAPVCPTCTARSGGQR